MVERSFARGLDHCDMLRAWLLGRENLHKRYLVQVTGFNLGIPLHTLFGRTISRETADVSQIVLFVV